MKYFENPAWVGSVTIHSAYLKYLKNHVYVVLNTCRFECSIQSSNSWSVISIEEILIQTDHHLNQDFLIRTRSYLYFALKILFVFFSLKKIESKVLQHKKNLRRKFRDSRDKARR